MPTQPPQPGTAPPDAATLAPVQLVLFTRTNCHLCELAHSLLEQVLASRPAGQVQLNVVDVDTDPALARRYGTDVPVVEVAGRRVARWQVQAADVGHALDVAVAARTRSPAPGTGSPPRRRPPARFVNMFTRRLD